MGFDWRYLVEVMPTLLAATLVTVRLAVLSFLVALLLGLVFALAEMSRLRPGARLVGEFLRLTPLLVQLFFAFYVLPEVGVALSAEATGVLVLGLHYGTYVAQVYLAGIRSVPKGQWEAARSLALPPLLLWGVVILPQAVRPMVPALGNYLIQLFKEVPILSTITVFELLNTANLLAGRSFRYLELLSFVGLVFLVLSYASSLAVRRLEARRERIG
jgi:polar amino acid transport system permease protein